MERKRETETIMKVNGNQTRAQPQLPSSFAVLIFHPHVFHLLSIVSSLVSSSAVLAIEKTSDLAFPFKGVPAIFFQILYDLLYFYLHFLFIGRN